MKCKNLLFNLHRKFIDKKILKNKNLKLNFENNLIKINKKKKIKIFSKKLIAKIYKFFTDKSSFENSELKVSGLRYQPFLFSKNFKKINDKKKKRLFNKKFQQNKLDQKKLFLSHLSYSCLKFFEYIIFKPKKAFPISFNIQKKFEKNLFEETADELKFFLEIDLIKFSISLNQRLIRCWLFDNLTLEKTKLFWSSYFSSCFKAMIQNQKFSDLKNFRKEMELEILKKKSIIPDWELYWLSEDLHVNLDINVYDSLYSSFFLLSEENLKKSDILTEKIFSFFWKNRLYKKVVHFKSFFETDCTYFTPHRVYLF